MSSMPECVKCGRYVHSGPVLCDECRRNPYNDRVAAVGLIRELIGVLAQVPKLARGPSRELWDGIMSDVLTAKRKAIDALAEPELKLGFRAPQPDALVEAATRLLHACERADEDGELALTIDGTLLDDVRTALAAPRPERTYSAEDMVWGKQAAFVTGTEARNTDGYPLSPDEARVEAERLWPSGERKHTDQCLTTTYGLRCTCGADGGERKDGEVARPRAPEGGEDE